MTEINTSAAAFIFGLITSMHCVLMCGPLLCALMPLNTRSGKLHLGASLYQLMRVLSYTAIGALLGGFGDSIQGFMNSDAAHIFPWILVALLFIIGFGLEKLFPQPAFVGRLVGRLQSRFMPRNTYARYGFTGALTPLLPCGPLYMIFGVCLFTGSAAQGAAFMFAFGLGTVPLLMLVHLQYTVISKRWLSVRMPLLRRVVALVTALFLTLRLSSDVTVQPTNGADEAAQKSEAACPMCVE